MQIGCTIYGEKNVAKMKIGVLTLPFGANYGCLLQSYALYTFLDKSGYDVIMLSRGWNRDKFGLIYQIKRWIYYNIICRKLYAFYKKINRSPILRTDNDLLNYVKNNHIDTIIVGSDQVWRVKNTRGANLNFFLDFLDGDKSIKKISYAASFGVDIFDGTEDEKNNVNRLIHQFNSISVREKSGVEICKNLFNIDVDITVDPTFLLGKETYMSLFTNLDKSSRNSIVTYLLDSNERKKTLVNTLAKKRNKSVLNLYSNKIIYSSVEFWLNSIANADYVIVDSFHGMVFSLLFEKQFIVINNHKRGSTRFLNLLKQLDLCDRCIEENISESDFELITSKKINYDIVSPELSKIVIESKEWLSLHIEKDGSNL